MAAFSRRPLSSSVNGVPVSVSSTTSPGTTVHAPGVATTTIDMVTLWLKIHATTARQAVVHWGSTSTNAEIFVTIPAQDGLYMVVDNALISGTTATIGIYATATNGLAFMGYTDRLA